MVSKTAKRQRKAGTAPTRKTAKSAPKTKKARAKKAKNTGIAFEKRARDAIQFLHPDLLAKHNEKLITTYDRLRQFDVTLQGDQADLRRAYEAKDYGSRVSYEKPEAFETKVSELKSPPTEGAGIISAHGFQKGPLERARALGSNIMVREMYQLRPVADEDWDGRVRSFHLAVMTRTLTADDVQVTLANDKPALTLHFVCDRESSFLYDENGRIVGNLLDIINGKLRSLQSLSPDESTGTIPIELPSGSHVRLGDDLFRVLGVSMKPKAMALDSTITTDFSTAARDTLLDCLSGRKWIIPNPEKAISASRSGRDLALTFEDSGGLSLDALRIPSSDTSDETHHLAELSNAIKLQVMLRVLHGEPPSGPNVDALTAALEEATRLFVAGEHIAAEAAYWKTCETATSLVALVNLSFLLHKRGEMNGALNLAMRTIELFPLEVNGYANAAVVLMDLGRFDEARNVLDAARVLHAGRLELMRLEGQWLAHEQEWARGATTYAHLTILDPLDAGARLGVALCESRLDRPQAAAWDASQALALGLLPGSRGALALRMLVRVGDWTRAASAGRDLLQRMDAADPSRQEVQLITATACYEAGQPEMARELSRELTIDDPSRQYLEGLLNHQDGRFLSAAESFGRYTVQRPTDPAGWRNLSLCLSKSGKHKEAYEALLQSAFGETHEQEYWTVRLAAAVRAGAVSAALASARMAAAAGVDCGKLLMDLSLEECASGRFKGGVELRRESLSYATTDGATLAERAVDDIYNEIQGSGGEVDIEAVLSQAEDNGARPERLTFARLLLAIHRSDQVSITNRLSDALALLSPNERIALASEAMGRRRCQLALALLGDGPGHLMPAVGPAHFPHSDALKSLALMHLGRLAEALPLEDSIVKAPAHPIHSITLAYIAYARGDNAGAIEHLDQAVQMFRAPHPLEQALRAQCLAEAGEYGILADLLRTRWPQLPVAQCSAHWARTPRVTPMTLVGIRISDPQLADALALATRMTGGAEHVGLMTRSGRVSRVVSAVLGWEAWFTQVAGVGDDTVPFLLRIAPLPARTVERLLGGTADGPP